MESLVSKHFWQSRFMLLIDIPKQVPNDLYDINPDLFNITGFFMTPIIRHIPMYYLLTQVLLSSVFVIKSLVLGQCFLWSLFKNTAENC
jgi:hypothetical protein